MGRTTNIKPACVSRRVVRRRRESDVRRRRRAKSDYPTTNHQRQGSIVGVGSKRDLVGSKRDRIILPLTNHQRQGSSPHSRQAGVTRGPSIVSLNTKDNTGVSSSRQRGRRDLASDVRKLGSGELRSLAFSAPGVVISNKALSLSPPPVWSVRPWGDGHCVVE